MSLSSKSYTDLGDTSRAWLDRVSTVAVAFERRWTLLHLARLDPELARLLKEQRDLFDHALLHGTIGDIETQGAATVRGWEAAIRRMEDAGVDDSAYMIGRDRDTGLVLAVGQTVAPGGRVAELHGQAAVYFGVDELAALLALPAFVSIVEFKKRFPGAELTGRYPREDST